MIDALQGRPTRDSGLSLVELAIYVTIVGFVAAILVGVMLGLFRSEQAVSTISTASNESQVVLTQLTSDVRNARQFVSSGSTLVASVANTDDGASNPWQCVEWVADPSAGTLTRSDRADSPHSPAGSAQLATGIEMISGVPFFAGSSTPTSIGELHYSIRIDSVAGTTNDFTGEVSNRAPSEGSTCFS